MAFVSKLAVEKELKAGELHALTVKGVPLTRSLRCVADPARYQSRAVRAFIDLMFDPSAYHPEQAPTPLEEEVRISLLLCLLNLVLNCRLFVDVCTAFMATVVVVDVIAINNVMVELNAH